MDRRHPQPFDIAEFVRRMRETCTEITVLETHEAEGIYRIIQERQEATMNEIVEECARYLAQQPKSSVMASIPHDIATKMLQPELAMAKHREASTVLIDRTSLLEIQRLWIETDGDHATRAEREMERKSNVDPSEFLIPRSSDTELQELYKQIYPALYKEHLAGILEELPIRKKIHYKIIDSRARNTDIYREPNQYLFELDTPLHDVMSIQLHQAEFPHSNYTIREGINDQIFFQELNSQVSSGTYYTATVSEGNYSIADLATEIASKMSAIGGSTYTTTINSMQRKLTISSNLTGGDGIFRLLFRGNLQNISNGATSFAYKDRSIGVVIGFSIKNFTGAGSYTGDLSYNLDQDRELYLSVIDNQENMMATKNSQFLIQLDVPVGQVKYVTSADTSNIHYYYPPMKRLQTLHVVISSYNGSYNFHGRDHSFTLRITCIV